jgi:autotransporter translocation and assembly factor TamB
VTVDYADYQTPQAHANAISVTGAPLLNLKNQASAIVANLNNPGGSTPRGPFTFSQISYEICGSVQTNVAPVGATVVTITMKWSDSTTGLEVKRKAFQVVAGPNGTPHTFEVNGPARADTLNVTIANNASSGVQSNTSLTILQSSRDYAQDSFRSVDFQQSGFTTGTPKLEYNVLGQFGASVAAGGSATQLMAAYSGLAHLTANTAGNNAQLQVTIAEAATATPLLSKNPNCLFVQSDASGFINETFYIPNIQQVFIVNNSDAAAHIVNLQVTALNQPGD